MTASDRLVVRALCRCVSLGLENADDVAAVLSKIVPEDEAGRLLRDLNDLAERQSKEPPFVWAKLRV